MVENEQSQKMQVFLFNDQIVLGRSHRKSVFNSNQCVKVKETIKLTAGCHASELQGE